MSADCIKEIRDRVEKATAGKPWKRTGLFVYDLIETHAPNGRLYEVNRFSLKVDGYNTGRDGNRLTPDSELEDVAKFIQRAPSDIQFLLTELESAKAELARLKSQRYRSVTGNNSNSSPFFVGRVVTKRIVRALTAPQTVGSFVSPVTGATVTT